MQRLLIPAALFLALLPVSLPAQQNQLHKHESPPSDPVRFALIVARHGVRSPTKSNTVLDRYSAQPWPAWPVEPGELTPRGARLLELFGAYDRLWLTRDDLLPAGGCPPSDSFYFVADTDHRTIASARALASGLAPDCNLPIHFQPQEPDDPIFHFLATYDPTESQRLAVQQALEQRQSQFPAASYARVLKTLANILDPDSNSPKLKFLTQPQTVSVGKSDHLADIIGPLATSSSLSENLLLEYADGMQGADLGWGRLKLQDLPALLGLHTAYFDLAHRTPALARAEASNLLQRILLTLEQAATGAAAPGAIGPARTRLVLLDGHDTNLAGLAALLGLHWTLDGRADDTPPGAQLTFELHENRRTQVQTIRIVYRLQTLGQLRAATLLTERVPPATQVLAQPECAGRTQCPLAAFQNAVGAAIDPAYLQHSFNEVRQAPQ
jgi:4-phytase/acid phosphatase